MAPQQLAQPAVRIAHIADDPRPAHARLHARRQQSRFQPVHAEGAFVRRLGGVIDKTGIVRTGLHAIGAPHAAFVVDHHDPVLALEGGLHRAYRHAGRVVAVVAQPGQQHVGRYFFPFEADLVLVYRGAKLPVRRLVFNGAAHGTGLAPDTAPQVDQHRIASANIPCAASAPTLTRLPLRESAKPPPSTRPAAAKTAVYRNPCASPTPWASPRSRY